MEKSFPYHGKTDIAEIRALLRARGEDLTALYARANALRKETCGDAVPVRAIIEFSNFCGNECLYCGLRASNPRPARYRITFDEILDSARGIVREGVAGTIVLQAGESPGYSNDEIESLLVRIRAELPNLAITLSLGNRPKEVYARWQAAGMDRYLIRFETTDPDLFARIHPDCTLAERIQCLRNLKGLGVQAGGGFMIGLPGETVETLAYNIWLCRELDLDMIGIGPYIPNPETPMGDEPNAYADDPEMFFRAIACLRLANPDAHIPATTAFDAQFPDGRNLALQRGANVFMPNATPGRFRKSYQLYPGKPCIDEDASDCTLCVKARLRALGRPLDPGPGHSMKQTFRI